MLQTNYGCPSCRSVGNYVSKMSSINITVFTVLRFKPCPTLGPASYWLCQVNYKTLPIARILRDVLNKRKYIVLAIKDVHPHVLDSFDHNSLLPPYPRLIVNFLIERLDICCLYSVMLKMVKCRFFTLNGCV